VIIFREFTAPSLVAAAVGQLENGKRKGDMPYNRINRMYSQY